MKILIKVTKDILKKSSACSNQLGKNCAIALAVRDVFPDAHIGKDSIIPDFYRILARQSPNMKDIKLPAKARRFITIFDDSSQEERAEMEPISFKIEIPNEVINSIGIPEIYKILSESSTLELIP